MDDPPGHGRLRPGAAGRLALQVLSSEKSFGSLRLAGRGPARLTISTQVRRGKTKRGTGGLFAGVRPSSVPRTVALRSFAAAAIDLSRTSCVTSAGN